MAGLLPTSPVGSGKVRIFDWERMMIFASFRDEVKLQQDFHLPQAVQNS
jgi:hypothetical protein